MDFVVSWDEFLNESMSRAPLYHAIKTSYATKALQKDSLACHGFQRTWPGGKRLKDDEPGYYQSWWMRGISLTRDLNFAKNWESVVFVFDQDKLMTRYRIVPYNWGYSIGRGHVQGSNAKREREEFLVTSIVRKPLEGSDFIEERDKPGGYIRPLSSYLNGFYIVDKKYMTGTPEEQDYLLSHPLFMGFEERR